jgi:hypothetical protein
LERTHCSRKRKSLKTRLRCYSECPCCQQKLWPFQTHDKIHSLSRGRSRRLGRENQNSRCLTLTSYISTPLLTSPRRRHDMLRGRHRLRVPDDRTLFSLVRDIVIWHGTSALSTGRRSPEPACHPPGGRDAGWGSLTAKEPRPGVPSAERSAALARRLASAASIPVARPAAMPASLASLLAAFAMSFRSLSSSNSSYLSSASNSGRWRTDSMTESRTEVVPRPALLAAPGSSSSSSPLLRSMAAAEIKDRLFDATR